MAAPQEGDAWILRGVSPSFLFVFGLLLAPSLWLQARPAFKAAQAVLFFALAAWARPRGCWRTGLASLIFLTVTVAVNLAVPLGRVLWLVGPWKITQGALEAGLGKGLTLVALAYLSRFCVRPDLRLPGTAGRYVARTFFYLNRLLDLRRSISLRSLAKTLDRTLETLWAESPGRKPAIAARKPAIAAKAAVRGLGRPGFTAALAVLGLLAAANYGILLL